MKNILLISQLYLSQQLNTSTDIMVCNIIDGLEEAGYSVSLFAISEKSEEEALRKRFRDVIVHSALIAENLGKYQALFSTIRARLLHGGLTEAERIWVRERMDDETVILAHCPGFESVYISHEIKKEFGSRYLQYWSDPAALSGILPEQMNIKRIPYRVLEAEALSYADEIIYGTKTLYRFQRELYKKQAGKMRWTDVAYCEKAAGRRAAPAHSGGLHLVYSGNYYSSIRDIMPLYEAMREAPKEVSLSIYGASDLALTSTCNVDVHGRVSHEEVAAHESAADVMVCILNLNCIQVPGKVFYSSNADQRILVLLDGKYKDVIRGDLEEYERFEFCENKKEAIAEYLKRTRELPSPAVSDRILERLSPKTVSSAIVEKEKP